MPHKFNPADIGKLDNPKRRSMLPPEEVLTLSGLKPGDRMIDIGAGSGYFSLPASVITGPEGHVTAVDSSPEMVAHMKERFGEAQVSNMEIILSGEYDFAVGDKKFDFAFISTVLHEIEDKERFLKMVYGVLASGGRVAVVEWVKEVMDSGPPVHDRIDEGETAGILTACGFTSVRPVKYSAYHYIVTARK